MPGEINKKQTNAFLKVQPVRVDEASMSLKSCDENSNSTPSPFDTHRVASAQETFCTVMKSIETSIFVPCTEP